MKRTRKSPRVPYDKLSDDDKVLKNWSKALGLYTRGEWSVAILRCGTCLELAINFAIRQELVDDRKLPLPFVDGARKRVMRFADEFSRASTLFSLGSTVPRKELDSLIRVRKLKEESALPDEIAGRARILVRLEQVGQFLRTKQFGLRRE